MVTKAEILSLLPGNDIELDEKAMDIADACFVIAADEAEQNRRESIAAAVKGYLQVVGSHAG